MGRQKLDTLIDKIKAEAIEAAEFEAKEILDRARKEAQSIATEAEAKREALLFEADKEAQATIRKGEIALKQAARDLLISVRNDLLKLLKNLLDQEVEDSFNPDLMEKAILIIMENVGSGNDLRLPEDMESELAEKVRRRLQQSDTSISISTDSKLPKGFSVVKTEEGWSYHISSKEITGLLNDHLSTKWVGILEKE
jgi:F0F1-type ATP synthase membrane subunit b/b'